MTSVPSLGIDFGTSTTVGVLRRADGTVRPLLFDGTPLLPSAVYLEPSGRLLVGRDAIHAARLDPTRFEPTPKRRIADGTVLLGGTEVSAVALAAAVLRRVAVEAARVNGTAVRQVTLTHPAAWAGPRRDTLIEAARRAGLPRPRLVAEPVAAASYFTEVLGHRIPAGSAVVVYDFGAGTFDASAVLRGESGFDTAVVDGLELGGLDIDAAIVDWLAERYAPQDPPGWQRLAAPATVADRRHREQLWTDVRTCKEQLSRSSSARLAVPVLDAEAHLTRTELERLAAPLVEQTAASTAGVIAAAELPPRRIAGLFLVGGGSRLPLAASVLHRSLHIAATAIEQPELVVAEGSLRAPDPDAGGTTRILPVLAPAGVPAAGQHGAAQPGVPAAPAVRYGTPGAAVRHGAAGPSGAAVPTGTAAPAALPTSAPPGSARPHGASGPHGSAGAQVRAGQYGSAAMHAAPGQRQTAAGARRVAGQHGSAGVPAAAGSARPRGPAGGTAPRQRSPHAGSAPKRGRDRQAVLASALVLILAAGAVAGWYGYRRATAAERSDTPVAQDGRPAFVPAGWRVAVPSVGADDGWHDNTASSGSCQLRGGALSAARTRSGGTGMFSCGGAQARYRDVAVDTTVRVRSGCAGIWLRTGDVHGYFVAICADAVGLHLVSDTDPSDATALHRWPLSRRTTGRSVEVGVLARGNHLTVYADGSTLGSVTNGAITAGRLDLGVYAPTRRAAAVFSAARAWQPA